MLYKEYEPAEILSPFIEKYIIFEDDGLLKNRELTIVPGKVPEIAIHFGDPVDSFLNYPGEITRGYLYGPHNRSGFFKSKGNIKCLCVSFRPFGINSIFGLPQVEVRNFAVELDALCGVEGCFVIEQVNAAKSKAEIIKTINRFLIHQLQKQGNSKIGIEEPLNIINKSKGLIKIHEVSRMLNINIKTLERRFKHLLGLTPKEYANIIRLYYAYELSIINPGEEINDIAYKCGYYDQPHFINTIKRHTKITPEKLFKQSNKHVIYVNRLYTF